MKKKGFIGLSTLLLVLLLGLFTVTYADSERTWTEEDLKNVIYNMYTTNTNYDMETAIDKLIENNYTTFTTILNDINNYDYVGITIRTDNPPSIDIQLFNTSNLQNTHPYLYRNCLVFNSTPSGKGYYLRYVNNTQTWAISSGRLNDASSYNHQTNTRYFSTTIYSASNNNTILYSPQYYTPSNLFDGPYNPMLFIFMAEPTETIVDVDIFEDIPAYNYNVGQFLTIGTLYIPYETEITDFSLLRSYYTGDYWKYIEVTTEYNNNYIFYEKWSEGEDFISYDVIFNKQYIQDNNIYIITWWDATEEPAKVATGTFYIKNGQTVIQNGTVIPSGDKITGSITELQEDINNNNDFWKETYDKLFTIDSGDAEEIINNFLESSNLGEYGLESGEIAILNVLNGEPSDFIISWSSVIIPNLKDNTPTQLVPAGNINFSKVSVTLGNESYTLTEERLNQFMIIIGWVQLIMGISVVILTIANVWETLMRALGVGVGLYEDNADEHSTIVNVGEDGTMRTTEVVRTPTKSRIWYIHKKY